ncbi:hypothetical protein Lal_00050020 [Lupinus albus]|uniref:Uncharacterized protein n=1 Tax=Lupinus albus TaxID=3870 RepID=A0A6A5M7R8_LUPAL|nr:hypothetical protein Lalb_Chr12g0199701 [Lupinus albus]KAF1867590.1 hypothetical protein Lal_00050020 [Lupinus albus]
MGLENMFDDDFERITPIKTVATATKTFTHRMELLDLETTKEVKEEEQEECHTPTSPSQILKTPLLCPPPPKKPRVARRSDVIAPSQRSFQVSHDLASVFVLQHKPNIKETSLLTTFFS